MRRRVRLSFSSELRGATPTRLPSPPPAAAREHQHLGAHPGALLEMEQEAVAAERGPRVARDGPHPGVDTERERVEVRGALLDLAQRDRAGLPPRIRGGRSRECGTRSPPGRRPAPRGRGRAACRTATARCRDRASDETCASSCPLPRFRGSFRAERTRSKKTPSKTGRPLSRTCP
jgi:hypothetical protein